MEKFAVKTVVVFGPFGRLRGLGHIMDSVGCGDSNKAHDSLTQKIERKQALH